MGVNKPLSINQSSDRIRGGGCRREPTTRRNCVAEGEGAVGGETKDEMGEGRGGGREGENADGYKLPNGRRYERRPLDKSIDNSRHSQHRPLKFF